MNAQRLALLAGSAVLVALVAAGVGLPGTTSANFARFHGDASPVALRSCAYARPYAAWFQPVAAYYGCNPAITPRFDFARLYSATAFADPSAAVAAAHHPARAAHVSAPKVQATLVRDLALAHTATAKYVNNLALAKANGYQIITKMIPNMGYHFMNPNVKGFDVQKPPILVYERSGSSYQLGAIEWVWTAKPATPPLPGARYGSFGAGCHYTDGSFVPATAQASCPTTDPQTDARFSFWHPTLVTMHVWLWYPNPSGLFASTNPLVAPFNND